MKASHRSSLAACAAALVLAAAPARAGTDWTTFGFDAQRTDYNPDETVLGAGNAGRLKERWAADLGGPSLTQPTVATGVLTAGGRRDLVYVGTLGGDLVALNRLTGARVWRKTIGSVNTGCEDFPGGVVGILGTPTLDRAHHAVYVAAGDGKLHARDEATGNELPGWPVTVAANNAVDIVYTSPTLVGQSLYVGTASACDDGAYRGRVVRVDISKPAQPAVVDTWFVNGPSGPLGGGVWSFGGISAETDGSALYAATGNAIGTAQNAGLSERVVRLSPDLRPQASNYPGLTGRDVDFGATPVPFRLKGCAKAELAVMNKTGALFVYDRNAIGAGALQRIQMANIKRANVGEFINNPAYDPARGLLFVANPTPSSDHSQPYKRGLVALKAKGCALGLAWQHTAPPPGVAGENSSIPPVVANGVVYYVQPLASSLAALDETTGRQLWSSGSLLKGGVFASPAVANGQLLAVDFAGKLHAFAP